MVAQSVGTSDLINDEGLLEISESLWESLNQDLEKDEIKQLLSDAIEEHNVRMPMIQISEVDMAKAFDDLCKLDALSLIKEGRFSSRYDFKAPKYEEYIDINKTGMRASNYFHQETRWLCDSMNSPSPYRVWHTERFRLTLFNALWSLKHKEINESKLRSTIGLRKYIAAQFSPASAKAIFERFNSKRVLDFSSGWGDRLLAFASCEGTEHYTGIDPNEALLEGYMAQIEAYGVKDKTFNMIQGCAEEVRLEKESVDTVFTSPPYFNIEKYTKQDNQSFKKFKKLEDWLEKFLFKSLENAWYALEKGGHLIINISDVYSNHRINKICDPMFDYMATLEGSEYQGTLGLRMAKRPNSKAGKIDGVFAEPIFVWKKGE